MKALLFVLIVLIAVFVFIRAYETQHAASGTRQSAPGSTEVGALDLRHWGPSSRHSTPGDPIDPVCWPRV